MNDCRRISHTALIACCVFVGSMTALCRGEDGKEDPKKPDASSPSAMIEGEWVSYADTANGRYTTIKEHRNGVTILTTYDPNQVAVHSHQSEYTVDDQGGAHIFRYRNRKVILGINAGAMDPREKAYLFHLDDDSFYEVHGMLPKDTGKPTIKVWKRLKKKIVPKSTS